MSDRPNSPILEHLRPIRGTVDAIREDVHDPEIRVTGLEANMAALNRRQDRADTRLERIEHRLEIVDA